MLNYLCISVTFLDPVPQFNGRADADEPEWPPSPLRVFQALVAAAASRWREQTFKDSAQPALEWLQQQDTPIIVAPKHHIGVPVRIAVPNNDLDVVASAWAKGQEPKKQPNELKTMKTVRPARLLFADSPPECGHIHYLYHLVGGSCPHLQTLITAARSITHLGWGVNMVAADASVIAEQQAAALSGERWYPVADSRATSFRTPIAGTLGALIVKHQAFLNRISRDAKGNESFNPVPPLLAFRVVGYRRATDPVSRPFIVFELRNDDGSFFRYPQERLIHIAGMVRHLAIQVMRRSPPEDVDDDWVETYVAGHVQANATEHRQFSYLPMPSIGHQHADQKVRRVMIVAPLGDDRFLRHLTIHLDGQQLKPTPETKLDRPPTLVRVRDDKVARYYTEASDSWASVTPVILPGHDDHKPDKARKLIEKALVQSGIEQQCEFEWSAFSQFPKSLSSHKYDRDKRPTGYIRPGHLLSQTAVHLKLRFNDGLEVPGPLAIGAGRHCGLGIFARMDGT